jgi:hypothetical protein
VALEEPEAVGEEGQRDHHVHGERDGFGGEDLGEVAGGPKRTSWIAAARIRARVFEVVMAASLFEGRDASV